MKMPLKRSGFTPVWFTPLNLPHATGLVILAFNCSLTGMDCLLLSSVALFILWVRFNGGSLGGDGKPTRKCDRMYPRTVAQKTCITLTDKGEEIITRFFYMVCVLCVSQQWNFPLVRSLESFVLRLLHPPAPHSYSLIYSPFRSIQYWPGLLFAL